MKFQKVKNVKHKHYILIFFILLLISIVLIGTYASYKNEKKYDILTGQFGGEFTISFNSNGGTECQNQTVDYNGTYGELCQPTYYGYNLDHWEDNDGNVITRDTIFNKKEDITLNAIYNYACGLTTGDSWAFNYTNGVQEFNAPCEGTYKFELWGAQGAYDIGNPSTNPGGKGAYTSGKIALNLNDQLFVYVGGHQFGGNLSVFNNGTGDVGGYNGGGATDVRLVNGEWDNFDSLKSRIMVAAGGGVSMETGTAGAGGGIIGYDGGGTPGGTQTYAGKTQSTFYATSTFGRALGGCTGGNGYYPGGGATCAYGSGGGSSYISGHFNVDSINEAARTDLLMHTGYNIHYSGKHFTDTSMIDGNGYSWTFNKTNQTNMPTHDGTSTMIGNEGHGYAKITYISPNATNEIKAEIELDDHQNEKLVLLNTFNSNLYNNSYQWYLNDQPISNATNNKYIVEGLGNYKLITTNEYGISSTSNIITISTLTNQNYNNHNALTIIGNYNNNYCLGKYYNYDYLRKYSYQAATCNINTLSNLFDNGNLEYYSIYRSYSLMRYDLNNNELKFTQPAYSFAFSQKVPVDINKTYDVSLTMKLDSATAMTYAGLMEFDVDKKMIEAINVMFIPGSTTTLARDLNQGDTVVYLTNTNGFQVSASSPDYQRGFSVWNYQDSTGYQYPVESYTRNIYSNLFTYLDVNKATNTITLSAPWTGPALPAGTSLSQTDAGGVYNYGLINMKLIGTSYQTFTNTMTGTTINGYPYTAFRPGTKYVSIVLLHNYGDNVNTITSYIKNYSLKER